MSELHDKLIFCIEQSGKSVRAVARESAIPYSRLHSALKNQRSISFEDVAAISRALDVSLQDLAGNRVENDAPEERATAQFLEEAWVASRAGNPRRVGCASLEDFLDWWYAHSGRLENYDAFLEEVDLFHEPPFDAKRIMPVQSGAMSLASICFEIEATDHLVQTLDGFTAGFNRQLVKAHIQALQRGEPVLSHPTIDEVLPNGKRINKTYRRILAPVRNADGTRLIANFTKDISLIPISPA